MRGFMVRPDARSVGTRPGRTAFTRTPDAPSSSAALRTSASSAALLTQYGVIRRWVRGAAIDEIATIEPPPAAVIARAACLMVRNAPSRLVAMTWRHVARSVFVIGPTA